MDRAGWLIGPVVSLVVTVTAWDRLDVEALALGLTVGSAATFLMVLIGAWRVGVAPRLGCGRRGMRTAASCATPGRYRKLGESSRRTCSGTGPSRRC